MNEATSMVEVCHVFVIIAIKNKLIPFSLIYINSNKFFASIAIVVSIFTLLLILRPVEFLNRIDKT